MKVIQQLKQKFKCRIGTDFENGSVDALVTVFENGSMVREFTMDEIRANA